MWHFGVALPEKVYRNKRQGRASEATVWRPRLEENKGSVGEMAWLPTYRQTDCSAAPVPSPLSPLGPHTLHNTAAEDSFLGLSSLHQYVRVATRNHFVIPALN